MGMTKKRRIMEKLAKNGGKPVRTKPYPTVGDKTGRWLGKEEIKQLTEVIKSGRLNRNGGTKVVALEKEFAKKYGVKFAVASTSGTAAIHAAVGALNLNPGDEIITTTITDIGTVIPILQCNCIPIFADIDPETGNITGKSVEKMISAKTKAVIVVHLFGQTADMDGIMRVAKKHGLTVIEDCSQSHRAMYKGKFAGAIGDMGTFSFQQSKQMTTGDGGMTISNDEELAERARLYCDKGWPRGGSYRGHMFLGMNYRMTELQGAVALAQLNKVDGIVRQRQKTAGYLLKKIKTIKGIIPPKIIGGARHSWWIFSFTIDGKNIKATTKEFAEAIQKEGAPFGVGYIPNPMYMYDVIKKRTTYGTSGCPWTCPHSRKNIKYDIKDHPGTVSFINSVFVMGWNEGIKLRDCDDLYRAIKKVAEFYSR